MNTLEEYALLTKTATDYYGNRQDDDKDSTSSKLMNAAGTATKVGLGAVALPALALAGATGYAGAKFLGKSYKVGKSAFNIGASYGLDKLENRLKHR